MTPFELYLPYRLRNQHANFSLCIELTVGNYTRKIIKILNNSDLGAYSPPDVYIDDAVAN